jgi:hypothetical protein
VSGNTTSLRGYRANLDEDDAGPIIAAAEMKDW